MADNKAMERIEKLLDAGNFVEFGALVTSRVTDFSLQDQAEPSDGVIIGYGQIEGGPGLCLQSEPGSVKRNDRRDAREKDRGSI